MSDQASLHLCNLAGLYGLARAREILAEQTPQPAPVVPVTTPEVAVIPQRTPEQQAQRDTEDEGAKNATAAQLKEALDGLGIAYPKHVTRSALLTLWTSRP